MPPIYGTHYWAKTTRKVKLRSLTKLAKLTKVQMSNCSYAVYFSNVNLHHQAQSWRLLPAESLLLLLLLLLQLHLFLFLLLHLILLQSFQNNNNCARLHKTVQSEQYFVEHEIFRLRHSAHCVLLGPKNALKKTCLSCDASSFDES